MGFSLVKELSIFFDFCLPLFNATFQCEPYTIFKTELDLFFDHENIENEPQKLLIIGPNFFFHVLAGCPNQPRIDFSCYKYVPRRICSLICVVNPSEGNLVNPTFVHSRTFFTRFVTFDQSLGV